MYHRGNRRIRNEFIVIITPFFFLSFFLFFLKGLSCADGFSRVGPQNKAA